MESTKETKEEYESKLSKQEYWETCFEKELQNFEDHGDDGEVWFGKDVQKKTVEYLLTRFPDSQSQLTLLDVGTGNGALLFKLIKKKFEATLVGIDYSDFSIAFSKRIQGSLKEDHPRVEEIVFRFENAFDMTAQEQGKYDMIHDKGTFDVVYMNKDLSNHDYARAMHHRLSKTNDKAVFVLTSCNLTSTEMDEIFAAEGLFRKLTEIKGYRQFTYGGVTGQNVSTNVYQV